VRSFHTVVCWLQLGKGIGEGEGIGKLLKKRRLMDSTMDHK